jgi:hypothetical protein
VVGPLEHSRRFFRIGLRFITGLTLSAIICAVTLYFPVGSASAQNSPFPFIEWWQRFASDTPRPEGQGHVRIIDALHDYLSGNISQDEKEQSVPIMETLAVKVFDLAMFYSGLRCSKFSICLVVYRGIPGVGGEEKSIPGLQISALAYSFTGGLLTDPRRFHAFVENMLSAYYDPSDRTLSDPVPPTALDPEFHSPASYIITCIARFTMPGRNPGTFSYTWVVLIMNPQDLRGAGIDPSRFRYTQGTDLGFRFLFTVSDNDLTDNALAALVARVLEASK